MIREIVVNLFSDVIFVVIAIALGWILFVFTRRNKLLKFFRVHTSRRLVVYVSRLRVKPGYAIGIGGEMRRFGSPDGFSFPPREMLAAIDFRDLFNYFLPSLSERPNLLSKLLISDVAVDIVPSPLIEEPLEQSASFITLGGPPYNAASRLVETKLHSQVRFKKVGDCYPHWLDGGALLIRDLPEITDETCGFVERIVDDNHNRSIFYVAGLSELGTAGAAHFLLTQWGRLYQRYGGDSAFLVMLSVDPTDFRQSTVIFER